MSCPCASRNNPPKNIQFQSVLLAEQTRHSDTKNCLKLVLVGDCGVGKTSLILKFADGQFSKAHDPFPNFEYKIRKILLEGHSKEFPVVVWDTAGTERLGTLTTSLLRGTAGLLICFDITSNRSFENAKKWFEEIQEGDQPPSSDSPIIMLVGNKRDLGGQRQVPEADAEAFASQKDVVFLETSALNGENVEEAFKTISSAIIRSGRYRIPRK